eukprot:TRINITY_DN9458_c0_g1_i1.p1 TRINITY_DN9458_c0_g1~~TRINITY_DN9458_c0_g1_i1.p1  ORF type:complete len:395 (+),score=67.21 TRINITY_DN9458_c0_g1_i1:47-1231(+)
MERHIDEALFALGRLRASQKVFLCAVVCFVYFLSFSQPETHLKALRDSALTVVEKPLCRNKDPVIILYQPKVPDGNVEWNTGVWTGYGYGDDVTLKWAAAGVKVRKTCPTKCIFSRDHTLLPRADGVLMELINHPKFLGKDRATQFPVPWPPKVDLQKWILFYFESTSHYSYWTKDLRPKFDFTMTPEHDSDIPITSVCPWGRNESAFLSPPPPKTDENTICDFSKRIPDGYEDYILEFFKLAPVHAYRHHKNKKRPEKRNPQLSDQLSFVGSYKFALVLETVVEDDWVTGEFSQAFLAGAVPIYLGPKNALTFSPGQKSFINVHDYATPKELADHVNELLSDEKKYMEYFEWKKSGLSPNFQEKLKNCYHYGECRLCEKIAQSRECRLNTHEA